MALHSISHSFAQLTKLIPITPIITRNTLVCITVCAYTTQPLYQLPNKMGNTHSTTHTYSLPPALSLTHARARSSFLLHTAFSFQSAPIGRSVDQSFALIRKINEKSILMMKAYILFTYTHTKPKSLANASSFIKLSLFIYVFCCWRYGVCVCALFIYRNIFCDV